MEKSKSQTSKRLIRNQLSSLIIYGKIETTKPKSKLIKTEARRLINKINKLNNKVDKIRFLKKYLYGGAVEKSVNDISDNSVIVSYDTKERLGDNSLKTVVEIKKISVSDKDSS